MYKIKKDGSTIGFSYLAALQSASRYGRETIEELCAIQMNAVTCQIVDVHHAHDVRMHACCYNDWVRDHIHGLSFPFRSQHGFPCEAALIHNFKQRLRGKDILAIFANVYLCNFA